MLKINIILALRNLRRDKTHTAINVMGLSLGIAVCILIILYLQFNFSVDNFHPSGGNIYRVNTIYSDEDGKSTKIGLNTFDGYNRISKSFAEIESTIKIRPAGSWMAESNDTKIRIDRVLISDSMFFEFFGYELIRGNPREVLLHPNMAVIEESFALALFGNQDPIGKAIRVYGSFNIPLEIVGVARSPKNSHLEFDLILPFTSKMDGGSDFIDWYKYSIYLYAKTHPNSNYLDLEEKINKDIEKSKAEEEDYYFQFQPLETLYLRSSDVKFTTGFNSGNITYLKILILIGIIILIIAAVNFINISTSKASQRAKEVGIKKTLGASKLSLMVQFLGESIILAFTATLIALIIAAISLPYFNDLVNVNLSLDIEGLLSLFIPLALLILLLGVFAGFYPAVILSSFKPTDVLKGKLISMGSGEFGRKLLIGFQLLTTLSMISVSVIIYQQLKFVDEKDMGFDKEDVMVINIRSTNKIRSKSIEFMEAISELPGVKQVSRSTDIIGLGGTNNSGRLKVVGKPHEVMTTAFNVDHNYLKTFGLTLIKGRDFNLAIASDSTVALVNEEFVKQMKLDTPLSETVDCWGYPKRIIGVVKDFHFSGLHKKVDPVVIIIARFNLWNLSVKYDPNSIASVISESEKIWKRIEPDVPFATTHVDQLYDRFYEDDDRLSKAVTLFAFLSILIAAFGLYGLISHTIVIKQREIGLRKILGAPISYILGMLIKRFVLLYLIAALLAIYPTLVAADLWLNMFAYKIEIGISPFLLSAAISFLVIITSILIPTLNGAIKNPVDLLRND